MFFKNCLLQNVLGVLDFYYYAYTHVTGRLHSSTQRKYFHHGLRNSDESLHGYVSPYKLI